MKANPGSLRVAAITAALAIASAASAQTPAPAAASAPAATPAVQKVSVKGVARFDFDKATVNPDDGTKLMSEVRSMKNVTWQTITVTGHTDSVGPASYNQKLSERRAQAVSAFLIDKGVKEEKIRTDGRGPTVPVADNRTAQGRAANRRTEIEFQGIQSIAQQ
jgi:OOP family OmpA-OmpF porin